MSARGNMIPLEWESDFFSIKSARLELDTQGEPIDPSELNRYPLVQAKVAASDSSGLDQLAKLGFVLAEGEIDLLLSLSSDSLQTEEHDKPPLWLAAGSQHIAQLRMIAGTVFALSRFRPPWYQPQDSGRFYAEWVQKAVAGTFDHCCLLVVDEQGMIQGFVTLRHIAAQEVRVGLLAVCPEHQGRGVGRKLMTIVAHWCKQHQINQVRITTQTGNIQALRLYIQCGALPISTTYWLYRG